MSITYYYFLILTPTELYSYEVHYAHLGFVFLLASVVCCVWLQSTIGDILVNPIISSFSSKNEFPKYSLYLLHLLESRQKACQHRVSSQTLQGHPKHRRDFPVGTMPRHKRCLQQLDACVAVELLCCKPKLLDPSTLYEPFGCSFGHSRFVH